MPGCPYFIANTFVHLFGSLFLTGISTEQPIFTDLDKKPLTHIALFVIVLLLLSFIINIENTALKYFLFIIFCILFGQILSGFVKRLRQENLLSDTLTIVAIIFVCMFGVGIYDKNNILKWTNYLYAGLVGLFIAILINSLIPKTQKIAQTTHMWLSRLVVLLFTLYLAHDVQVMKLHAKKCNSNPDYISDSLNVYLDIINLFTGVGDSFSK
jgi:FtsH-binding integral membrane protein